MESLIQCGSPTMSVIILINNIYMKSHCYNLRGSRTLQHLLLMHWYTLYHCSCYISSVSIFGLRLHRQYKYFILLNVEHTSTCIVFNYNVYTQEAFTWNEKKYLDTPVAHASQMIWIYLILWITLSHGFNL